MGPVSGSDSSSVGKDFLVFLLLGHSFSRNAQFRLRFRFLKHSSGGCFGLWKTVPREQHNRMNLVDENSLWPLPRPPILSLQKTSLCASYQGALKGTNLRGQTEPKHKIFADFCRLAFPRKQSIRETQISQKTTESQIFVGNRRKTQIGVCFLRFVPLSAALS